MLKKGIILMVVYLISTSLAAAPTTEISNNIEASQKFLQDNKKKANVITLQSGLQYKIQSEGKGNPAGPKDYVKLRYRGTLIDGTEFESSKDKNAPSTFKLSTLIPGWVEALQIMKPGAKWTLYVPADLAYGKKGIKNKIPPNATLIFDIELLEVIPPNDESVTDVLEEADENL